MHGVRVTNIVPIVKVVSVYGGVGGEIILDAPFTKSCIAGTTPPPVHDITAELVLILETDIDDIS